MYKIVRKLKISPQIYLMDIEAPRIAKAAKPGQFVILRLNEKGERIPLTICDYDIEKGIVTVVFQIVGESTKIIASCEVNDYLADVAGPLGQSSKFIYEDINSLKEKNILFAAGGVGAAPIYPQINWLSQNGIKADVILGTKSKAALILDKPIKEMARNLYICTDDGSLEFKGLVTDKLKMLLDEGKIYNYIIAIGPILMMKAVCDLTKEYNINTTVSLNPIMVDGTGMCGACRVTVGNEIKFACVDGPEFDGHLVNFEELMRRLAMFRTEEGRAMLRNKEGSTYHSDKCNCGGE